MCDPFLRVRLLSTYAASSLCILLFLSERYDEFVLFCIPNPLLGGRRRDGWGATVNAKSKRLAGGDGELVGSGSDADLAEIVGREVRERRNVGRGREGLPVGGIETDGGVGEAVAADSADHKNEVVAVAQGQEFEGLLRTGSGDEVGILVGQRFHLGDGAEQVACLHGLAVLLVVHQFQPIVFGQEGTDFLWHLQKEVFQRLGIGWLTKQPHQAHNSDYSYRFHINSNCQLSTINYQLLIVNSSLTHVGWLQSGPYWQPCEQGCSQTRHR